jgi:hypothetical protein
MLESYREESTPGVEAALPADLDWNTESGGDVGGSLPTEIDVDRSLGDAIGAAVDADGEEPPARPEPVADDVAFASDDDEQDDGVRTTRYDEE